MSLKSYGKARHLVVDIETLGTAVPAPILSIGAVCLDAGKDGAVVRTLNLGIDPCACTGAPDAETVLWWNRQPAAVRREAFVGATAIDPWEDFSALIEDFQPDYFWGKAPDFDFGHLAAQLAFQGRPVPWRYWQLRDIRTLEGLWGEERPAIEIPASETVPVPLPHVAIYDAMVEAELLRLTLARFAAR